MAYSESQSDIGSAGVVVDQIETKKKKVVVLGTGWAGTSFLKNLDASKYDVQVVSPRNYFAFTPLLPSVTCGTVEARSIVEPIRKIIKKVCWCTFGYEIWLLLIFCYRDVFMLTLSLFLLKCREMGKSNFLRQSV